MALQEESSKGGAKSGGGDGSGGSGGGSGDGGGGSGYLLREPTELMPSGLATGLPTGLGTPIVQPQPRPASPAPGAPGPSELHAWQHHLLFQLFQHSAHSCAFWFSSNC